jgi:hypothetical protein
MKDQYGTLNIEKLIERIKLCYIHNPKSQINFGPGGSGIGTFMIFDSCTSLYVAVQRGICTTVCCTFATKLSARKRNQIPKNIHLLAF